MRFLLIIFSTTFFLASSLNAGTKGFTGRQIYNSIVVKLNENGMAGKPAVDFNRIYPSCSSKLFISQMYGSWKTVRLTCPSDDTWKLIVRTNLGEKLQFVNPYKPAANLAVKNEMVALRKSIGKNEVLSEEDLIMVAGEGKIGGGYYSDVSDLVGRKSKIALSAGTILKARHLEKNYLVHKHQLVTIEHYSKNIIINTEGIAQTFGQKGERIWVKNVNSGKKVLCWVQSEKKVTTTAKIY